MFILKKLLFKFMEFGLGLKPYFLLETHNPIFLNFKLSESEAKELTKHLPKGSKLRKIKFSSDDLQEEYWISYNFYEICYPKKVLRHIRKVRCEINTFIQDAKGRLGIYVIRESPYVSRERSWNPISLICDFAEKLVTLIYGCGNLVGMHYELSPKHLKVELSSSKDSLSLEHQFSPKDEKRETRLSDQYWKFNDFSFFNFAKTFDRVYVDSGFSLAKFTSLSGKAMDRFNIKSPYLKRPPDQMYYHLGPVSYLVSSMNRS